MTTDTALSLVSDGLLTIPEATRIARVGKTTLYGAMAAGDLPYVKIGAGRRIPRRALELWMARRLMVGNDPVLFDGKGVI